MVTNCIASCAFIRLYKNLSEKTNFSKGKIYQVFQHYEAIFLKVLPVQTKYICIFVVGTTLK